MNKATIDDQKDLWDQYKLIFFIINLFRANAGV